MPEYRFKLKTTIGGDPWEIRRSFKTDSDAVIHGCTLAQKFDHVRWFMGVYVISLPEIDENDLVATVELEDVAPAPKVFINKKRK